jgi:L-amino acid N-acyltransferase YncA
MTVTKTMTKIVKLKDQTEVLIRPMARDDLEKSLAFFSALPEEDRAYFRRDMTELEVFEERIREMEQGSVERLIALVDNKIVADGSVVLFGSGWKEHVGELRLIVARPYQQKGLGSLMASELCNLARRAGLEEIVVRMMRSQTAARNIFCKLGFCQEVEPRDYPEDWKGKEQDLILMRCDLEELWREFKQILWDWSLGDAGGE